MIEIDDTIGQLEQLYRAITGNQAVNGESPYAPIPAEQDPVSHVNEEMERLLRTLAESLVPVGHRTQTTERPWMPPITVCESATELVILVDLPGATRDRLDVKVTGGHVLVTGNRPAPSNGHRVTGTERPFGAFHRAVRLPSGLRTTEMSAQLKEGVLEISIPREVGSNGTSRSVPVA